MSLETLLEAAQFIEVDTDEDGRPRVKTAPGYQQLSHYTSFAPSSSRNVPTVIFASTNDRTIHGAQTDNDPGTGNVQRGLRAIGMGTRDLHNHLEKKRRAHLKDRFDDLRAALVTCDDDKASNLMILRNAVRTIQSLQRQEKELEMEMQRLAREKIWSQSRISILKMELVNMNSGVNIQELLDAAKQYDNQSTSTATAEEGVTRVDLSDDDAHSTSTLSTSSPNARMHLGKSLQDSVVWFPKLPQEMSMESILKRQLIGGEEYVLIQSGGKTQTITSTNLLPVVTSLSGDKVTGNMSVTQLLQQAIYQRQENKASTPSSTASASRSYVEASPVKELTKTSGVRTGQKRKHKEVGSKSSPVQIKPCPREQVAGKQQTIAYIQADGSKIGGKAGPSGLVTSTAHQTANLLTLATQSVNQSMNQANVITIPSTSTVTLNQLLPSRYPPAVVNPIDLATLLRLSGGATSATMSSSQPHIVTFSSPIVSAPVTLTTAVPTTLVSSVARKTAKPETAATVVVPSSTAVGASALNNLQSVILANALLQQAQPAVRVVQTGVQGSSVTPTITGSTSNLAQLLGGALTSQVTSQAPVQLITAQQLQQLLLQLQLQQQIQQQLAQQLVQQVAAAERSGASVGAGTSGGVSSAPSVSVANSSASSKGITMPTIPLSQLLGPITADLSGALSANTTAAALQQQLNSAANLQQTLATTAQLSQMLTVQPHLLKSLGQIPLLQQPTIALPIMVSLPSVGTSQAESRSSSAGAKRE